MFLGAYALGTLYDAPVTVLYSCLDHMPTRTTAASWSTEHNWPIVNMTMLLHINWVTVQTSVQCVRLIRSLKYITDSLEFDLYAIEQGRQLKSSQGRQSYPSRSPERTHGSVLNLHTEGFSAFSSLLSCSLPLSCLLSLPSRQR